MPIMVCGNCSQKNMIYPERQTPKTSPVCGKCGSDLSGTSEIKDTENRQNSEVFDPNELKQVIQNLLHNDLVNYNCVDEGYFSAFYKEDLFTSPITALQRLSYGKPAPMAFSSNLPPEPKAPKRPFFDQPKLPDLELEPLKPAEPKTNNAAYKMVYLIRLYLWEKTKKRIDQTNKVILDAHKKHHDVVEWAEYNFSLEKHQTSIKEWANTCARIRNDDETNNKNAMQDWAFGLAQFNHKKNKIIKSLKELENESLTGNSISLNFLLDIFLSMHSYPQSIAPSFMANTSISDKIILIEIFVTPFKHFNPIRSDGKKIAIAAKTKNSLYNRYIYGIILNTVLYVIKIKATALIDNIAFNIKTADKNPATGLDQELNIASVVLIKEHLKDIDINHIEPEAFFKLNCGIAAASLATNTHVAPIMKFNLEDDRFVDGREISQFSGENLAEMPWEDFEHLVRQLFEVHFKGRNAEVRVTRSSRDRGVDAIIFDPDPITGGKIVIQAKRYTNTVEVAAVRELFGTTQNEGANKGILVTTSSFGSDSYEFARDKNLTLINGAQLLSLLKTNGFSYDLDIETARNNLKKNH